MDKVTAIKLMEERGYSSHFGNSDMFSMFKTIDNQVSIHADVYYIKDSVCLSFVGLKLLMTISTGKFSLTHPDFKRYEEVLYIYALQCLIVNPFDLINS